MQGSRFGEDEVLPNCEEDGGTLQSLGIRRLCYVGSPSASGRGYLFCCCFEVCRQVVRCAEVATGREFVVSASWTARVLPAETLLFLCIILLLYSCEWDPVLGPLPACRL